MMNLIILNYQVKLDKDNSNFRIVFDESRHATGTISAPFVAGMSTVVLFDVKYIPEMVSCSKCGTIASCFNDGYT